MLRGFKLTVLQRRRRSTFLIGTAGDGTPLIVKIAREADEDTLIDAEVAALTVASDTELASVMPRVVERGTYGGRAFAATTYLAGTKALLLEPITSARLVSAFAAASLMLRTRGDAPIAAIPAELARASAQPAGSRDPRIGRWTGRVIAAWEDIDRTSRPTSLSHADYTAANLLFRGDAVSGVIDWATGSRSAFPWVDHLTLAYHLWTKRLGVPRREALRRLLAGDTTDAVGQALEASLRDGGCQASTRRAALATMSAIRALRALHAARPADADGFEADLAAIAPEATGVAS